MLSCLLLAPALVSATSIVARTVGERARQADRVVLGQVLESRTVVQEGDPRRMRTITKVAVGESYKGRGPSELEIIQQGGRWGLWEAHVTGDASFEPGQTALLLLRCRIPGAPGRCTLVGLGEGKIEVLGDEALVRSISRGTITRRKLAELVREVRQAITADPPAAEKVTR